MKNKITGIKEALGAIDDLQNKSKFKVNCPKCSSLLGEYTLKEFESRIKVKCKNCLS